jgi:acyl carrier protein
MPVPNSGHGLEKGGMLDEAETLRQVTEALASIAKVAGPVTVDTHILHDLNLDSVAVMDLVMVLETRFDTVIPMDRLAEIETVGDLVRMLSRIDAPVGSGG